MKAKLIDGRRIAAEIRSEVALKTMELKKHHAKVPNLAVVMVGNNQASVVYVRNKQRAAINAGMLAKDYSLQGNMSQSDLTAHIRNLGNDNRIHGVLVQLPLPKHLNQSTVIAALNPDKDVDGLHPVNVGLLASGKQRFVPATPAGIQQMILRSGYDFDGKHVVICGRSEIVGKPLSLLLMQRLPGANATVTVCHTRTHNLATITRQADILVAAMGRPRFITSDMVKKDSIIIDVGVNREEAPERKSGYRLVGDVDFDSVSKVAAAITPVPGGVGPMTIAMLLKNTLKAAQLSIPN